MKIKPKRFRLLTVLLTAVMLVALSLNVMAAKSNAVTKDGLTAQLFTDKDSYKTGESVKATVQVDNHTGREVFIFAQINVPEGVKLASDSTAFDARLQNGETWTTPGGVVSTGVTSATSSSTATGDNMQAGFWVILTLLAVCGIATLFVYGKNKTTWLSIMLCIAMVGGMVAAAIPVQAADMNGDIQLSCTIQVDGKDAEVSTTVSYVIYDEAEEEAEESTEAVTPSEPSDSSDTSEPSDSNDTSEPSDSSDTSEPSDSSDTSEPSDASDASEPSDSSDTSEPSDASDASEPSDSSDTSEPSDSSDTSEPSDSDNTPEQNVKVYYYNDFEDPEVLITDNAKTLVNGTNALNRVTKDNNSYLEAQYKEANKGLYFEPHIASSVLGANYIFEMSLSTNDTTPSCLVQYRCNGNSDGNKNDLLVIEGNKVKLGDEDRTEIASLEKDKWVKIGIKLTHTTGEYSVYLYDQESGEWEYVTKHTLKPASILLDYLRIYFDSAYQGQGTLCVDEIAIYEGDKFMDVSDMEITKGTVAQPGEDVEMEHPKLADIGEDGIVVMAGETTAYAKGSKVTIDSAVLNTAGDDIIVPASFIKTTLGVDVDGDTAELGTVAKAAGKNVVFDSRGLIVITDSDISLEAKDDIKLLTMLAGYLQTGEIISNYAAAPVFTQSAIDEAIETYEASWLSRPVNKDDQEKAASALYYLTLVSKYYPEAKHSKTGETVVEAAVDLMEHILDGGNEPFACVGPYWGHAVVAAAMVLIQETPAIYDVLEEHTDANGNTYVDRMDWLMKALAISGNWGYHADNFYKTGFDLLGNFGKDYNPNYRNTYLSIVLSAAMYFEEQNIALDTIFTEFSYDTYMAKFEELGFTNIIATWSAAGKNLMENGGACTLIGSVVGGTPASTNGGTGVGVKEPFVYSVLESSPYMEIGDKIKATDSDFIEKLFMNLISFTYHWEVTNDKGNKGASDYCYILTGKETPLLGQMGMMKELDGTDGGGNRSRTTYAYDSWEILVPVYANMKLLGYWDSSTPEMRELDNRIYVGNEDMLFKLHEGYRGYSSGSASNEYEYTMTPRGHKLIKDIWYNFHCMLNTETTVTLHPNVEARLAAPVPTANPKSGDGTAPNGTYPAVTLKREYLSGGYFADESYYPLDADNNKYENAEVSFDIVMGNDMDINTNDCVFMLAKKEPNMVWSNANMQIQFVQGWINIYNGSGYVKTGMRYEPNYRYHVDASFDVSDEKYTIKIKQTWPENQSDSNRVYEYTATDFNFRNSGNQIDYVDSLAIVKTNEQLIGWAENVTITGTIADVPAGGDDNTGGDNTGDEPVVYYKNDYENGLDSYQLAQPNNTITLGSEGCYLEVVRGKDETGACRIQPTLSNVSLQDKLIVEIDLSADNESSVPAKNDDYYAYLQYRYNGSSWDFPFYIYSDNAIRVKADKDSEPIATLTTGTWMRLRFVIDPTTGNCDAYAYDEATSTYGEPTSFTLHPITTAPGFMRLNIVGTASRNLCVDNFKIYNGDIGSGTVTTSYYDNSFDVAPETGGYSSDYLAQGTNKVNYIPVNKYVDMEYAGSAVCRLQPEFTNVSVENEYIVEVDLSPDSVKDASNGTYDYYAYMQCSEKKKLFYIYNNNEVRMFNDGQSATVATLSEGTWTKLRFVVDLKTGLCDAYVYDNDEMAYDEKVSDFNTSMTAAPTHMRFTFNGTNPRNLYVDNFKIYQGSAVTTESQ